MPTLRVWLNGERVADWTQSRGMHELAYAPDWVTSPAGRALHGQRTESAGSARG